MKIQIKESAAPEIFVDTLPNEREIHFISNGVKAIETYEGAYEVVPSNKEQKLLTQNKKMKDDVTVREIPVFVAENLGGGNTVYIADKTEVFYG